MEIQIAVVGSEGEPGRVCEEYCPLVATSAHVIDHHVVQDACLLVLFLDEQIVAGNLVVEHAFRNLQLRAFLIHGKKQRPHLHLRGRKHIVLEEERADGYAAYQDDERRHHSDK